MTKDVLKYLQPNAVIPIDMETTTALVNALKERLAQPEQEPVAWMYVNTDGECEQIEYGEPFDDPSTTPLYTHPPQRKPLTDEEIFACENSIPDEIVSDRDWCIHFARAIEAAHDIKETT